MSTRAIFSAARTMSNLSPGQLSSSQYEPHGRRMAQGPIPFRFNSQAGADETNQRHAEQFYLQKQIHTQTPMVIVLEDGEQFEGQIEWYDRNSLKVRGRTKSLIYKSAIKYMYKVGDAGQSI